MRQQLTFEEFKEFHDNVLAKEKWEVPKVRLFTQEEVMKMLSDIQLEIKKESKPTQSISLEADLYNGAYNDGMHRADDIIQQKIKALEQEPTTKNDLAVDCRSLRDIKKLVERKADALDGVMLDAGGVIIGLYFAIANDLPSVTPQESKAENMKRFTNAEWIGFLSEQFDISRTSAKEMLHVMMSVKKEDNFKKQFNKSRATGK